MLCSVNKKRRDSRALTDHTEQRVNFRQSVSSLTMAALLLASPYPAYPGQTTGISTPRTTAAATVKLDKKFKGKLPIT